MSEPKRRFFESGSSNALRPPRPSSAPIPSSSAIFAAPGPFVVSGEVHGDGEVEGGLNLSVTGSWHGNIQAQQAIVAGKITGGLTVKDRLEIGYTAVIRGRVSARTIAIAKGAIVDGEIEVTSGAADAANSRKNATANDPSARLFANGDRAGNILCVRVLFAHPSANSLTLRSNERIRCDHRGRRHSRSRRTAGRCGGRS